MSEAFVLGSSRCDLGFDLYKASNNVWFQNEQRISVMVVPSGFQPLLVDTFDPIPARAPGDAYEKWNRTGLAKIRDDKLAINGGGPMYSELGSEWGAYTAPPSARSIARSR